MTKHLGGLALVPVLACGLALSGCGTSPGDRGLSGGLLGAGTGAAPHTGPEAPAPATPMITLVELAQWSRGDLVVKRVPEGANAGQVHLEIYRRLAYGPVSQTARLHGGELRARTGADVDVFAELLVRAFVPMGVALLLGIGATVLIALVSPAAAVVLAVSLLIAGGLAPLSSARAARAQEHLARQHHSNRDVAVVTALDHAPELRVAGRLPELILEAQKQQRDWGKALDRAAGFHHARRHVRAVAELHPAFLHVRARDVDLDRVDG